MARQNRIVIENGSYHVTTRIAHRAFLLKDPALKDLIVHWIYGIADFAGVEITAWNVMDNHLHLFLTTPSVPERYHLAGTVPASASGTAPAREPLPSTFSMRPAENRAPRWMPDLSDPHHPITPAGDCPSEAAIVKAIADGVPVATIPRPATGFMLSDEEMLERLDRLYAHTKTSVARIARRWAEWRVHGQDGLVDREKDAYCRRMYNVTQYMKTLKQRITQYCNENEGHVGQLWEGRFHSALVDHEEFARKLVSGYIELNAVRAGIVGHPSQWKWCSFAVACSDGPYAERARAAYAKMMGASWKEAKSRLESIFAEKLPQSYNPKEDPLRRRERGRDGVVRSRPLTVGELIRTNLRRFLRDGFVSRRPAFRAEVLARFHPKFPGGCRKGLWRYGRVA